MTPLEIALKEYGKEAWSGVETNPEVLKYFHDIGHRYIHDDETPWCAAFLNWVLMKSGFNPERKLNARSFLNFGQPIDKPRLGDIVVLWRIDPKGNFGHCGLYISETKQLIYILGGNQNGQVCIKAFPKTQLLGYRMI